jgi:hypothetical protein
MDGDLHRHTAVAFADCQIDIARFAGGDSPAVPVIDRLASTRYSHGWEGYNENATVID